MLRKVISLLIFALKINIFVTNPVPQENEFDLGAQEVPRLAPGICVLKGALDFSGKLKYTMNHVSYLLRCKRVAECVNVLQGANKKMDPPP